MTAVRVDGRILPNGITFVINEDAPDYAEPDLPVPGPTPSTGPGGPPQAYIYQLDNDFYAAVGPGHHVVELGMTQGDCAASGDNPVQTMSGSMLAVELVATLR